MRALEKRLGLSGLNYRADEKIKLMQDRIAHAKPAVDTSTPRLWADKKIAEAAGQSSPSKSKVAARERAALIALDNQLLARRIFNIMESTSAIGEIINDTRHLDVHPGTMNFKARVEQSEIIVRDNRIMGERLSNIKPYYGFADLNANRGMLSAKFKKTDKNADKKRAKKSTEASAVQEQATPVPPLPLHGTAQGNGQGGSLSARAAAPRRSQNQSSTPTGSQSARAALAGAHGLPKGVILLSFKIQDKQRIELIVAKEPTRDQYGVMGKCAAENSQRYELSFSSEQVSTLVDGDLLVTNVEKAEVWELLFQKVTLKRVDSFSSQFHAINPESLLDAAVVKTLGGGNASVKSKSPSKPATNRPTAQAGGRAGKAKKIASSVASKVSKDEHLATEEKKKIADEIGDSDEVHAAASKLQAIQRAKKAKAHTEKLRLDNESVKVAENKKKIEEEIGDGSEVHGAATKLQALHRGKKAKLHTNQLREEKREKQKIADEIGDSAEVHGAAAKLQAVHRGKKAKLEVAKLKASSTPGATRLLEGAIAGQGPSLTLKEAAVKSPQPKAPAAPRQVSGGRPKPGNLSGN